MLNLAHASSYHWGIVGTELHQMRTKMLVAEVHSLAGHGDLAFRYATEMRDYFLNSEAPDWEIAFTHTIYAHAAWVAGEHTTYHEAYEQALTAVANIADEEDQRIVQATLALVPQPD